MMTKNVGQVATVDDAIMGAVTAVGDVVKTTADTVSGTLSATLKNGGTPGAPAAEVIRHVATAAIDGSARIGAHLGHAAKGTVIGVLRGTEHVGAEAIDTIGLTAAVVIHRTAALAGKFSHAATGLMEGAIDSAQAIGVSNEDAAFAAARAALRAADRVGSSAAQIVHFAVTQRIRGVSIPLEAPLRGLERGRCGKG